MAVPSLSSGASPHVSLHEAASLARGLASTKGTTPVSAAPSATALPLKVARTSRATVPGAKQAGPRPSPTAYEPHTPVVSYATGDANRWDGMLNQLGQKYNVPPTFLKAVMQAESGGRPDAVGDSGHSVGLFQLHDQGYGAGMGDSRFDPQVNAERAVRGLSEAWHAGERAGFTGEHAVRAAYNYSFNPGGGWAYQGDGVVRIYNSLRAEAGQPPLT